ncbi:MAG: TIGR02391 family protein [Terriglobia bacterium]
MKLEPDVKSSVHRITDTFLRLGKSTPMHEIKVKLGSKRSALNELMRERVISSVGQSYLPCLLAVLEFEHADFQHYCLCCTAKVLNALKQLYEDKGPGQFAPDQIFAVIKRMIDPAAETNIVRVGMLFATDFSDYFAGWGFGPDENISSISVKDEILDFDTINNAWEKELESRKRLKGEPGDTPKLLANRPEISQTQVVAHKESAHLKIVLSEHSNQIYLDCNLFHPAIVEVAMPRFESGHYSDAVEAALKELNKKVKEIVKEKTGKELDGVSLMQHAFANKKPIITLGDLATQSGLDTQTGYQQIFSGAMMGIRNPLSHHPTKIEPKMAVHLLFLVSLLFFKLDEASRIAALSS